MAAKCLTPDAILLEQRKTALGDSHEVLRFAGHVVDEDHIVGRPVGHFGAALPHGLERPIDQ